MKRLIAYLMFILLFVGCHQGKPDPTKTDCQRAGLLGRVQTVRLETTDISGEGGRLVERSRGLVESNMFDSEGKQTEDAYYGADGSLIFKMDYAYDTAGGRIEKAVYDPHGALKEKESYTNDRGGSAISSSVYKADGALHSKSDSTYDDKGNKTEWLLYNARGALIDHWTYTYDPDGKKTEEARYYADGSLDARYVYRFDGGTLPTQLAKYNAAGVVVEEQKYDYEFDSKGNWTKKTTSKRMSGNDRSDFEPAEVASRTITYY